MENFNSIISNLENALVILPKIVREIPRGNLKVRPANNKWSVHEHACHLAEVQPMFFERLELMLSEDHPTFPPYSPSDKDLLNTGLDEALESFSVERRKVIVKLKSLTPDGWNREADYKSFPNFSVFRMFRHLSLHDYLHIYRIEELLLKNIL